MSFGLSSSAFDQGARIPDRYTCVGSDISPPLEWQGSPPDTRSLALIFSDPDAPNGTFHHWGVHDIPADWRDLPEDLVSRNGEADTLAQVVNDFGRPGYGGPCPPKGHGVHHYHFRLLALNVARLDLREGASCVDLAKAAEPHVLAEAELVGIFQR